MHKKTIALFCVFLTLLFVFAACKKRSPYGALIVDQQGMEHVIMTDANGVTVVDSEGNLVEIMTDSANKKPITVPTENGTADAVQLGKYETHPVTFPDIIESKNTVEDVCCKVTLPDAWEQIGNNYLILRHKETDACVTIHSDIGGTVTGTIDELNENLAKLSLKGDYSQTDVTIDGVLVTRTQYEIGDMTLTSYLLLSKNGKVCRIDSTVETDKRDAADVDALVQEIHFK